MMRDDSVVSGKNAVFDMPLYFRPGFGWKSYKTATY